VRFINSREFHHHIVLRMKMHRLVMQILLPIDHFDLNTKLILSAVTHIHPVAYGDVKMMHLFSIRGASK
jgi:hypothetical protein